MSFHIPSTSRYASYCCSLDCKDHAACPAFPKLVNWLNKINFDLVSIQGRRKSDKMALYQLFITIGITSMHVTSIVIMNMLIQADNNIEPKKQDHRIPAAESQEVLQ